jgi:hypothetical protein
MQYSLFVIGNMSHVSHIDLHAWYLAHVPYTCMWEILQIAARCWGNSQNSCNIDQPMPAAVVVCLPYFVNNNDMPLYLRHAHVHICEEFQIIIETNFSIGLIVDCQCCTRSLHRQWCTSLDRLRNIAYSELTRRPTLLALRKIERQQVVIQDQSKAR